MRKITIFDTTLRDGEQSPGCSMNLEEKLEVARQLERLRVDVIEAGFAISSPGDFESVKRVAETVRDCQVASLSRALVKDIDAAWSAVRGAASPLIHTFLSTSPVHMQYKLRMTPEQVLEQTVAMVKYAKKYCNDVEFSAEDAMRSEPAFLAKVVSAAAAAGATIINIPDTVGFTTPEEMAAMLRYLFENAVGIEKVRFSTHCHNDLGMAVANSLAAVGAGASQIECTINGLGERAGNTALEEVVMALRTRGKAMDCECGVDTTQIYRTSRLIYNIIGQTAPINKAIVGANAFAHESGIHQHGVLAERTTYEIMTPESIGLPKNRMVLGKHSGKHALENRLSELGYVFSKQELEGYFQTFKELCDKKKEITDLDLEAIVTSGLSQQAGAYQLERYDVHSCNYATANCVVRLLFNGESIEEVALGNGPIDAAYNAINKIVKRDDYSLVNYEIHSVTDGRDALGEVVVKLKYGDRTVTGRGLSTDILESSLLAYVNGVNKILDLG